MKKSFFLLSLASFAFIFGSCNTFIGMGRDIQSLGKGMVNKGHGQTWQGGQPAQSAPAAPAAPAPAAR